MRTRTRTRIKGDVTSGGRAAAADDVEGLLKVVEGGC